LERVKITAYITERIATRIIDDFGEGALAIVGDYSIIEAQGASKIGGTPHMIRNRRIFIGYCPDLAKAIQVKDGIMAMAERGESVGFEMSTVEVYVYTG